MIFIDFDKPRTVLLMGVTLVEYPERNNQVPRFSSNSLDLNSEKMEEIDILLNKLKSEIFKNGNSSYGKNEGTLYLKLESAEVRNRYKSRLCIECKNHAKFMEMDSNKKLFCSTDCHKLHHSSLIINRL